MGYVELGKASIIVTGFKSSEFKVIFKSIEKNTIDNNLNVFWISVNCARENCPISFIDMAV